jgi:hypothetical protein
VTTEPGGSPSPEPATAWSIVPVEGGDDEVGLPGFLRGTVFDGGASGWALRNDGPHAARRVELLAEDPEQPLEGVLAWDRIEPGEQVPFRAGRRLMTDNELRVRWFQASEESRYWRKLRLG